MHFGLECNSSATSKNKKKKKKKEKKRKRERERKLEKLICEGKREINLRVIMGY